MVWVNKAMIAGVRASRLRKELSLRDESSNGLTCLFPNRVAKNREHKDIPMQKKKRKVKLNELMRNIPKEGARAKDTLNER